LWNEIQVSDEVECPEELQIVTEMIFQALPRLQMTLIRPGALGITPEVLEETDPVNRLSLQDIGNAFVAGQWLHGSSSL
jgi:hypothetical protein